MSNDASTATTSAPTLPPLVEGASAKLVDPRPTADAAFTTKKGRPVDAVCTDCAIVETGKGTAAVRLHFVVVAGQDADDRDVKGYTITTDKYLSPGAVPYTMETVGLMGLVVKDKDGKLIPMRDASNEIDRRYVEGALILLAGGDVAAAGIDKKVMRIDLKSEFFNNADVIRVGGISQPPQKLEASATSKLVSGVLAAMKAGKPVKDGDKGGKAAGGSSGERNPTSAPPSGVKTDEPIPF